MAKIVEIKPKPIEQYKVLSQITNLEGKRVLEVGCRSGGLGEYLRENTKGLCYTGIDRNPDIIQQGKDRYPMLHLKCEDVTTYKHKPYDVVLAQDIFKGLGNTPEALTELKVMIAAMIRLGNTVGFTYTVLHPSKKYKDNKLRLSPWYVADFVTNLTPYIQMRTDFDDHIHSFGLYHGLDKRGKVITLS